MFLVFTDSDNLNYLVSSLVENLLFYVHILKLGASKPSSVLRVIYLFLNVRTSAVATSNGSVLSFSGADCSFHLPNLRWLLRLCSSNGRITRLAITASIPQLAAWTFLSSCQLDFPLAGTNPNPTAPNFLIYQTDYVTLTKVNNFLSDITSKVQNFIGGSQQDLFNPVAKPTLDDMISKSRNAGTLKTLNMPQAATVKNYPNKVTMPTQMTAQNSPQKAVNMINFDKIKQFLDVMQQPGQSNVQVPKFNVKQPAVAGAQTVAPTVAPIAKPVASPQALKRYGIPADLADPLLNVHEGWQYPTPQANPNAKLDPAFIAVLEKKIFPITDAAGIPRSLVAGQVAIESAYGTSNLAKNNNNFFGLLKGTDPTTGKLNFHNFDDPARGAEMYAYTMTKGNFKDRYNKDPVKYLYNLQNAKKPRYEGHSERPYEYLNLVTGNPAFQKYYGQ
jgi:flagellum-specific peptidoglycan hydrolase FlgJ